MATGGRHKRSGLTPGARSRDGLPSSAATIVAQTTDRPEVHLLEHVRPTVEVLHEPLLEAVVERWVQHVAKALASEPPA